MYEGYISGSKLEPLGSSRYEFSISVHYVSICVNDASSTISLIGSSIKNVLRWVKKQNTIAFNTVSLKNFMYLNKLTKTIIWCKGFFLFFFKLPNSFLVCVTL